MNNVSNNNQISVIKVLRMQCASFSYSAMKGSDSSDKTGSVCYMTHVYIGVLPYNHIWCPCMYHNTVMDNAKLNSVF